MAECAAALSYFPGKATLRDVTFEELEREAKNIPEVPLSRARHVISECARVQAFLVAATANDLPRMGQLFVESHRSLQHDYAVSCEELDYLVDTALTIDGVYGARMTGGGFGGCTVNLVASDAVEPFKKEDRPALLRALRDPGDDYRVRAVGGRGARRVRRLDSH